MKSTRRGQAGRFQQAIFDALDKAWEEKPKRRNKDSIYGLMLISIKEWVEDKEKK